MPDNPRIDIRQQNANINLTDKPYPAPENNQKIIEALESFNMSKNMRLVIRAEATARLFAAVAWSSKPKTRDVESAGILVGRYHQDTSRENAIVWGDAIAVIPFEPDLVRATKTSITITKEAWAKMLTEYVPYKDNGYLMLGWYHTHLGSTPSRFSGLDSDQQRRYFTGEYSFAVVLNPNQKKWMVCYGPQARWCKGELFITEETLAQFSEPKINITNVSGDAEQRQDGTIVHRNPDGSLKKPAQPTPSIERPATWEQAFGSWLERMGKRLNRPAGPPVTRPSSPAPPHEQMQPPAPRITIRETAKPKITILPKDSPAPVQRRVEATVFVVSAHDLTRPRKQNQEGLQIIEANIIDVTDAIIRGSENSTPSLSDPINARVTVNNDMTLEIFLCEEQDNAIIRISSRPLKEVFPTSIIESHIESAAKSQKESDAGVEYLLYMSNTPERVKLVVIQIKKEDMR